MERLEATFPGMVSELTAGMHAGHRLMACRWFARDTGSAPTSTNQDGQELPFQRWYRFKEAFAPRAVVDAIDSLPRRPLTCADPFGGSGTTALTCQFLGIRPTTIEVNPFLADLIEAKLTRYDVLPLMADFRLIVDRAAAAQPDLDALSAALPPSFVEPGVKGRWIFARVVAERVLALREAIEALPPGHSATLFRVLLGSVLIGCSNVVISGKGRRYRSGWQAREVRAAAVGRAFEAAFLEAVDDICRYGRRPCEGYSVLRGDSRRLAADVGPVDFALFSPPYPNSFDYTDVYNVELWMLGYLRDKEGNRSLREGTLRSHVQVKRAYDADVASPLLRATVGRLAERRGLLWDGDIPKMVSAYFADLGAVLSGLGRNMARGSSAMMVVGDSSYAGVMIDVASIAVEVAAVEGFRLEALSPVRSMRASPQQGGRPELGETLVHLTRE